MTPSYRLSRTSARMILALALAASSVFVLALPNATHAATYAFVNISGEVNAVTADSWMSAIASAVNIAVHSGVVLITSQIENIVGARV